MLSALQAELANPLVVLDSESWQLSPLKAQSLFRIPFWELWENWH